MAVLVAYGTNKQAYFDLFMASCERQHVVPHILGWGKPWVGFGHKTTETRAFIRDLPDDEVVVSVDPFDVVLLAGLGEIEAKFRSLGAPFVCGALKLGPLLRLVYEREFNFSGQRVPRNPTGYDFLNSGTWISTAGYARGLIDRLVRDFDMSPTDMDQEILTSVYVHRRTEVDIDWRCEIFHNLLFGNFITRTPDLKDLEFDNGRVRNIATGTQPCILHASGNALMEGIAKRLGYSSEVARPTENGKNYFKKALFHFLQLVVVRRPVRAIAAEPETSVGSTSHRPGPA
jgi:hypothetical protein